MNTTVMWILFAVSSLVFVGSIVLLVIQRRAAKQQQRAGEMEDTGAVPEPVIDQSVFDTPPVQTARQPEPLETVPPHESASVVPPPSVPIAVRPEPVSEPQPAAVSAPPLRDVVILVQREEQYLKNCFPGGREITVGRAPDNDLVLDDPSVSGHHCVFRLTPQGLALEDLNSSNGTLLGKVRVTEPALVEAGDRIWVGLTGLFIQSV